MVSVLELWSRRPISSKKGKLPMLFNCTGGLGFRV